MASSEYFWIRYVWKNSWLSECEQYCVRSFLWEPLHNSGRFWSQTSKQTLYSHILIR